MLYFIVSLKIEIFHTGFEFKIGFHMTDGISYESILNDISIINSAVLTKSCFDKANRSNFYCAGTDLET